MLSSPGKSLTRRYNNLHTEIRSAAILMLPPPKELSKAAIYLLSGAADSDEAKMFMQMIGLMDYPGVTRGGNSKDHAKPINREGYEHYTLANVKKELNVANGKEK